MGIYGGAVSSINLIVNDGAVVGVKAPLAYSLQVVTGMVTTAEKETITLSAVDGAINNGKKVDGTAVDVINEYEGIAKNDIVVVTKVGEIYNLAKAETVTGKATKINGTKLTIDGVEYAAAGTIAEATKTALAELAAPVAVKTSFDFTTEYTLYLDGKGGYIAAATVGTEADDTIFYVVAAYPITTAAGQNEYGQSVGEKTTYWVQAINLAGEEVIYQVTKAEATSFNAAALNKLYTVATEKSKDAGNGNLEAVYADFTLATGTENATASIADTAIKFAGTNFYFTDDVKFIYVNSYLKDLKVTVKEGVQELTNATITFKPVQVGTTSNYTVSYVFVQGTYSAGSGSIGEDILFLKPSVTSTVKVPYTDDKGVVKTGYEYTAYIDGEKTTITVADNDGTPAATGFVAYTVKDGVYTITGAASASNLKAPKTISNLYKEMMSTTDGIVDVTYANAEVINLVSGVTIDTIADLKIGDTVALVLTEKGDEVVMIYVTAAASRS